MSRSFRHVPIAAITKAESDKKDKARARRAWRRSVKQGRDVLLREISDVWDFCKDGKRYHRDADRGVMGK